MKGSMFLIWLACVSVQGVEFYYTLQKNGRRCFEDHLSEGVLMNGQVFFTKKGEIGFEIENSLHEIVLSKVYFIVMYRNLRKMRGMGLVI